MNKFILFDFDGVIADSLRKPYKIVEKQEGLIEAVRDSFFG